MIINSIYIIYIGIILYILLYIFKYIYAYAWDYKLVQLNIRPKPYPRRKVQQIFICEWLNVVEWDWE